MIAWQALGQMKKQHRFIRPTLVFLHGDQPTCEGCIALPGGDSPERVVFEGLKSKKLELLDMRMGRDYPEIVDAFSRAMTVGNEHEWVNSAAKTLALGSDVLWQILCPGSVENGRVRALLVAASAISAGGKSTRHPQKEVSIKV